MKILVATEEEYALAKRFLSEFEIIKTGVGAGNVINTCSIIDVNETIVNIGFCGSNSLPKGTVTKISKTYRKLDGHVKFEDFRNGYPLTTEGVECYTSNDFVTSDSKKYPVVYDMELNYIAAFPFKLAGAIKIVSDNLCYNEYEDSICFVDSEIWAKVKSLVYEIILERGK